MNTIVIYSSSTGFTQKYAKWISEELGCKALELNKDIIKQLEGYDKIIYGGSIMAGKILGIDKIIGINHNKLVVYAVGFTEEKDVKIDDLKKQNNISDIPVFYYRGGIKFEELGFFKKMIIKKVTGVSESIDCTKKECIKDLISFCKNK